MSTRWYGRSGSSSSGVNGCAGLCTIPVSVRPPSTTGPPAPASSTRARRRCSARRRSASRQELQQRPFPLRPDDEIDVRGAQHRVGVLRRKIAAPHNRHVWQPLFDRTADGDRLRQLRARHHRDGEQRRAARRRQPREPARDDSRPRRVGRHERSPNPTERTSRRAGASRTAARDISDSGSGCFPGVVDSGL